MQKNKTSWIVLGYTKFESRNLINFISNYYVVNGYEPLTTTYFQNKKPHVINKAELFFSDDVRALKWARPDTKVILNSRDLIDSVIDQYIMDVYKISSFNFLSDPCFFEQYQNTNIPIINYIIEYHLINRKQFLDSMNKVDSMIQIIDYNKFLESPIDFCQALEFKKKFNYTPTQQAHIDYSNIFHNFDEFKTEIAQKLESTDFSKTIKKSKKTEIVNTLITNSHGRKESNPQSPAIINKDMKTSNLDSWIVLSPSRSGSHVIIDYIKQSYRQTLKKECHSISYKPKEDYFIETGLIWHTNEITSINFSKPETEIIVSTRNLFDCVISHYIMDVFELQPHFRYNQKEDIDKLKTFINNDTEKIVIVDNIISWHCRDKIKFMQTVDKYRQHERFKFIDYRDFVTDFDKLSDLLGVPKVNNFRCRLIKMPDYRIWIKNYDDLRDRVSDILVEEASKIPNVENLNLGI